MDFTLSKEHEMARTLFHDFAEKEVKPLAQEVDETEHFPRETVEKMAAKVHDLRIFEDENGKMNLSIEQIGGQVLSISQFTLYANCKKGRRPSFDQAARPEIASPLYDAFNDALRKTGLVVKPGIFGAEMKVRLLNDGPVTLILDSRELF